ncbi:MAG TPA: hypothetical protein VG077_17330 [Verrucomicrobiae bacterium]|nr:hypothetical protein [Verrucomicrobiae bacterium]
MPMLRAPRAAWLSARFENYRQNWRYSGIRNVIACNKARLLLTHDGGERFVFGESPVMANRKMKQKNCEQKKRWEANAQNPSVMSWLVRERQGAAGDSPDPWIKTSPL